MFKTRIELRLGQERKMFKTRMELYLGQEKNYVYDKNGIIFRTRKKLCL